MIIKKITVGKLEENCYLVGDKDELIVIDPGAEGERILKTIEENSYKLKYILLTHCHYDHIGAVSYLKEMTGAKLLISEAEKDNYFNKTATLERYFLKEYKTEEPDVYLKDSDVIKSGDYEFKVITTPGHTSGSICVLAGNNLFSGDTIFRCSIGRTDLPSGDYDTLISSITEKILVLADETLVFSGHGEDTTVGYERNNNPFLR